MSNEGSGRGWSIAALFLAIGALGWAGWRYLPREHLPIPLPAPAPVDPRETAVRGCLKTLISAEHAFRTDDRDANKVNDYWVGDVSALYRLVPATGGDSIKLIEPGVALMDQAPMGKSGFAWLKPIAETGTPASKYGYHLRAMTYRVDDLGKWIPYHAGDGRNRDHFGFCAFPDADDGRRMLIVNEKQVFYAKKFSGAPADTFPADPLKDGWEKTE